jgi:hypothetical protein
MVMVVDLIWVFNGGGPKVGFPGGVFSEKNLADEWIARNRLTGVLTAYPLNNGCLDWAIANDVTNMKPEVLAAKRLDPRFVGSFSSASQEHFHYEDGVQVSG